MPGRRGSRSGAGQTHPDSDLKTYEVEKIVDERGHRGKKQYKLLWAGHSLAEATWVNEADIENGLDKLLEVWAAEKLAMVPRTPQRTRRKSSAASSRSESRTPSRRSSRRNSVDKSEQKSTPSRKRSTRSASSKPSSPPKSSRAKRAKKNETRAEDIEMEGDMGERELSPIQESEETEQIDFKPSEEEPKLSCEIEGGDAKTFFQKTDTSASVLPEAYSYSPAPSFKHDSFVFDSTEGLKGEAKEVSKIEQEKHLASEQGIAAKPVSLNAATHLDGAAEGPSAFERLFGKPEALRTSANSGPALISDSSFQMTRPEPRQAFHRRAIQSAFGNSVAAAPPRGVSPLMEARRNSRTEHGRILELPSAVRRHRRIQSEHGTSSSREPTQTSNQQNVYMNPSRLQGIRVGLGGLAAVIGLNWLTGMFTG